MIGIYKITKKENGKAYIGQSNDIQRRISEHQNKTDLAIDRAIRKYGIDAFTYETIEECSLKELDEKEIYWIEYYNTYKGFGYNCNPGGGDSRGENNGRTNLTNKDVEYIRDCYNQHKRRKEIYELFKDRISFGAFASIWDGTTWKDIRSEVYTKENKEYYMYQATNGGASEMAVLTDEEVMECRRRYVNESAKDIYKNYEDRLKYQTLQAILWGRHYKHLPVYSKKKKEWIDKRSL